MRKMIWMIMFLLLVSGVWGIEETVDLGSLSLKAGPTQPGEGLALAWVEALVYPRIVESKGVISLGVRVASPVKAVEATFDFSSRKAALSSIDRLSWSASYKLPESVSGGVHVVRYKIAGSKGDIQRTVEFFVEEKVELASGSSLQGEVLPITQWPLTVISSCTALTKDSVRVLSPGQKLVGLFKRPWYKVLFDNGEEGWVSAANVKEPTEDYYYRGYASYLARDYPSAIEYYRKAMAVDPEFVKGYLWLAKSHAAQGNWDAAVETILKALKLDERGIDSRKVADFLAQKFFSRAHREFKTGRYQEAVVDFRKVLALKPSSVLSWIEIGESLRRLGLESEARAAWREALRYDPENRQLHALLGKEYYLTLASRPQKSPASVSIKDEVAPAVAEDSLRIIREERTKKGTKIEVAIKSVVALTKSLGTPVVDKGWQVRRQGEKFLASYLCEQSGGVLESFDWLVDVDTRLVLPHNDNARLLMSRW